MKERTIDYGARRGLALFNVQVRAGETTFLPQFTQCVLKIEKKNVEVFGMLMHCSFFALDTKSKPIPDIDYYLALLQAHNLSETNVLGIGHLLAVVCCTHTSLVVLASKGIS